MSLTNHLLFLKKVVEARLETELRGNPVEFPSYNEDKDDNSELSDYIRKNELSDPEIVRQF